MDAMADGLVGKTKESGWPVEVRLDEEGIEGKSAHSYCSRLVGLSSVVPSPSVCPSVTLCEGNKMRRDALGGQAVDPGRDRHKSPRLRIGCLNMALRYHRYCTVPGYIQCSALQHGTYRRAAGTGALH